MTPDDLNRLLRQRPDIEAEGWDDINDALYGPAYAPGKSEAEIQSEIAKHLLYLGYCVLRLNGGGMQIDNRYVPFVYWSAPGVSSSSSGVADLCAIGPAGTLWVEVKRAGGKQSPAQQAFQAAVTAAGGRYVVARSIADVEAALA